MCCKHACLQTHPACLRLTIYAHLLQARVTVSSARVPACAPLLTHICCRYSCLQAQPMFLRPIIYAHLLQALVPANSASVPAPFDLRTFDAGTRTCKLSPYAAPYCLPTSVACARACKLAQCACALLFTRICCRHKCLQTHPVFLRLLIYAHLLQARVPGSSARVPAPYYLRTSAAGTRARKLTPCAYFFIKLSRICCEHTRLQTLPVCPLRIFYAHQWLQKKRPPKIESEA